MLSTSCSFYMYELHNENVYGMCICNRKTSNVLLNLNMESIIHPANRNQTNLLFTTKIRLTTAKQKEEQGKEVKVFFL